MIGAMAMTHRRLLVVAGAVVLTCQACASLPSQPSEPAMPARELIVPAMLHGKRLDLHVAVPLHPTHADLLVLYASGDGGWFGAAIDQWRRIARAGFTSVGFSSRAFLHIDRPSGAPLNPAR